MGVSLSKSNN